MSNCQSLHSWVIHKQNSHTNLLQVIAQNYILFLMIYVFSFHLNSQQVHCTHKQQSWVNYELNHHSNLLHLVVKTHQKHTSQSTTYALIFVSNLSQFHNVCMQHIQAALHLDCYTILHFIWTSDYTLEPFYTQFILQIHFTSSFLPYH